MLQWASGIWRCEKDGIMNMVKLPQSSVQPVELELTLHTVANSFSVWRKKFICLVVAHLPLHGENSSMLDYGKDPH